MLIKTKRLEIKVLRLIDEKRMYDLWTDEQVTKTYMLPIFKNYEDFKKLFIRIYNDSIASKNYEVGIYLNDELIGFMNATDVTEEYVEIGYAILPSEQGKGYASEAFKGMIDYLFINGIKEVRAAFFEENSASQKVMIKCGLTPMNISEIIEYHGVKHLCVYYNIYK